MANKKWFCYDQNKPAYFYNDFDEYFESLQDEWFWDLNLDLEFTVSNGNVLNVRCHLEDGEAAFTIEDYNYVVHNAAKVQVDCETALIIELEERIYHSELFIKA